MIKHIVMWKFKEEAEGCTKAENIAKVKAMLEALPEKIDFIREMQVNVNINPKEGMYDAVLTSAFDSIEDVERYRVHPEHKKISSFVALIREGRASVDYEI
ncbi:MAG: Dabb family protein [Clostridia bacterium]|nr:Dabb family protein [Clostridia bacterium]